MQVEAWQSMLSLYEELINKDTPHMLYSLYHAFAFASIRRLSHLSWKLCLLGLDWVGGYDSLIFCDRTWSQGLVAICDHKIGNGSIAKVHTFRGRGHSLSFLGIFCFHKRALVFWWGVLRSAITLLGSKPQFYGFQREMNQACIIPLYIGIPSFAKLVQTYSCGILVNSWPFSQYW